MELVNSRNKDIHLDNYEDKWNNLIDVVNRTLDDLQVLSIQAQDQALRNWFHEVGKSMEVVELKRSIKQLSDSPDFVDYTKEIYAVIKTGLDTSWITSMFIKSEKVVIKSPNLEDPEYVKLI